MYVASYVLVEKLSIMGERSEPRSYRYIRSSHARSLRAASASPIARGQNHLLEVVAMFLSDCSIIENYETEYDELELEDSPSTTVRGSYSYRMPCAGFVTSVRARGFCPNGTDVVLRLYNSTYLETGGYAVNDTNFTAECNTSAMVAPGYYEGHVTVSNISIRVEKNGYLSVGFEPECSQSKGCLFQPAIVNKTSIYILKFYFTTSTKETPTTSLVFAATVETEGIARISEIWE